jgi:putative sterol carrier protein
MARTALEIFDLNRAKHDEPLLRGVHGTYLFDIEKVGAWFVSVDDGAVTVDKGSRAADCVIGCSEEDFVEIVEGRRNLLTSALEGRVQIRGDVALAQKFYGLVGATLEEEREAA